MDQSTMLSALESNGVIHLPLSFVGDLLDIDRRIKEGDESGWLGDPTMGIFFNQRDRVFEVWGLDSRGAEYKACTSDTLDLSIIHRLRDHDWRTHDVGAEVLAHNEKLKRDQEAAETDQRMVVTEKLAWAIRRDFAQHMGGRGGVHAITRKIGD